MRKVEYYIETGAKEEFYTLWKDIEIDMRPLDENGNPTNEGREVQFNRFGNVMDYFHHYYFIQNLSKTKEGAIQKVKEMGLDIPKSRFDVELRHKGKPSIEAFGQKLQFRNEKWYGKATSEFFDSWKNHKEEMKKYGWSCWKFINPRTHETIWYMSLKPSEELS